MKCVLLLGSHCSISPFEPFRLIFGSGLLSVSRFLPIWMPGLNLNCHYSDLIVVGWIFIYTSFTCLLNDPFKYCTQITANHDGCEVVKKWLRSPYGVHASTHFKGCNIHFSYCIYLTKRD